MTKKNKLRVFVVDDSSFNRNTMVRLLNANQAIEVVGTADNIDDALEQVRALLPEIVTLDIDMPRMNAFLFLRTLMAEKKGSIPVLAIGSSNTKQPVFQVLDLGAFDFVTKSSHYVDPEDTNFVTELLNKITSVRSVQLENISQTQKSPSVTKDTVAPDPVQPPTRKRINDRVQRLVVIGASTGGPPALQAIFKNLSENHQAAIVVAQHMPEKFTQAFAERLNRICSMEIVEAKNDMLIQPGCAYIAPGGRHLELEHTFKGIVCKVVPHDGTTRWVPSIDRLFISAAQVMRQKVLAVVLTGMGSDGRLGVRSVFTAGGRILCESQQTAVVYGMPKEAAETGCVHATLPLDEIIKEIAHYVVGAA